MQVSNSCSMPSGKILGNYQVAASIKRRASILDKKIGLKQNESYSMQLSALRQVVHCLSHYPPPQLVKLPLLHLSLNLMSCLLRNGMQPEGVVNSIYKAIKGVIEAGGECSQHNQSVGSVNFHLVLEWVSSAAHLHILLLYLCSLIQCQYTILDCPYQKELSTKLIEMSVSYRKVKWN